MNNLSTTTNNTNINNTISQINSMIEKSSSALLCDTNCHKKKKINHLKRKIVEAKNNYETAPEKLFESEKNYYLFTKGENEYNEYLEEQLNNKSKKKINEYKIIFNNLKENNIILLKELQIIRKNSLNTYDLYDNYLSDNKHIINQLKNYKGDIFTNFRKSFYDLNENEIIKSRYLWFFGFYYLFVVIYIILLLIFGRTKYKIIEIFFLSLFVFFYPFIMYYFLFFIVKMIKKMTNSFIIL